MSVADDYLEAVDELIEAAQAVLQWTAPNLGLNHATDVIFARLRSAVDVLTLDEPQALKNPREE